jgi:hypothetical protein
MRIAALVIYQVVNLSGRNISRLDGPGLCSKVLGILNFPAPLTELPVHSGHRVTGCGDTTVVTHEELCQWDSCQPCQPPKGSLLLAGDCGTSRQPRTAIRQQYLSALLEDCSYFAHLVLRCVRGGDGSLHDVAAPCGAKPRPDSGTELRTRRVSHLSTQRELQNLPAVATETSFPELETLWTEVASRSLHISACEGGRL